jgi:hypothetical protein
MPTEAELIQRAKAHLKSVYDEDTVAMLITDNAVQDGTGPLTVECTVKVGWFTSDWRKTFRFENGQIVGMGYLPRIKLLRKWHRRHSREPKA